MYRFIRIASIPLKVALGFLKIYFWAFQKNNRKNSLGIHLHDYFLNAQKSIFPNPKATFNGTNVKIRSKAAKTIEPTDLK